MQILEKQQEELESAQKEYNDRKKVVDELRTGEVGQEHIFCLIYTKWRQTSVWVNAGIQVDAQYKLDDLKKVLKDWETKAKGYQKQMEDLSKSLRQHVEQWVILWWNYNHQYVKLFKVLPLALKTLKAENFVYDTGSIRKALK